MKKTFFIGCTHFNHTNIIKYCNRPFSSVEEMNQTLIYNWNIKVREDDDIYVLGDFALCCTPDWAGDLLKNLHGTKFLILGNHDSRLKRYSVFKDQFIFIKQRYIIPDFLGLNILLTHSKTFCSSDSNWHVNLYCHNHAKTNEFTKFNSKMFYNIGVDGNNFSPVNIDDIWRQK